MNKLRIKCFFVLEICTILITACIVFYNYQNETKKYVEHLEQKLEIINHDISKNQDNILSRIVEIVKLGTSFKNDKKYNVARFLRNPLDMITMNCKKNLKHYKKMDYGLNINLESHGNTGVLDISYFDKVTKNICNINVTCTELISTFLGKYYSDNITLELINNGERLVLDKSFVQSSISKSDVVNNQLKYVLLYNNNVLQDFIKENRKNNIKLYAYANILLCFVYIILIFAYERVLYVSYKKLISVLESQNLILKKEIEKKEAHYKEKLSLMKAAKESYEERTNYVAVLHSEIKNNVFRDLITSSGQSIELIEQSVKNAEGLKIKNFDLYIQSALKIVAPLILRSNIKLIIENKLQSCDLVMPKYIFYLVIHSLFYQVFKDIGYLGEARLEIKENSQSVSLVLEVTRINEVKDTNISSIFLNMKKIKYYLEEYGGISHDDYGSKGRKFHATFHKDIPKNKNLINKEKFYSSQINTKYN